MIGNAETELHQFSNQSFDFVVLIKHSSLFNPEKVLKDLLKIGESVIINTTILDIGRVRTSLLFWKNASYKNMQTRYNTPNLVLHNKDFLLKNIKIKKS